MKLDNVDEKTFGLFNNWLYTQELEHADNVKPELMELAKLWTVAGTWKIPSLQNQAMRALIPLVMEEKEPPIQGLDTNIQQYLDHAYAAKESTALKALAVYKMILVLPAVDSLDARAIPDGVMVDLCSALVKHHKSQEKAARNPPLRNNDYMVKEDE